LADYLTDKAGKGVLCNRIITDEIRNLISQPPEHRVWREIKVIEIGMICKVISMVTPMLAGDEFESFDLRRGITLRH
jgi:hypothetical protein